MAVHQVAVVNCHSFPGTGAVTVRALACIVACWCSVAPLAVQKVAMIHSDICPRLGAVALAALTRIVLARCGVAVQALYQVRVVDVDVRPAIARVAVAALTAVVTRWRFRSVTCHTIAIAPVVEPVFAPIYRVVATRALTLIVIGPKVAGCAVAIVRVVK